MVVTIIGLCFGWGQSLVRAKLAAVIGKEHQHSLDPLLATENKEFPFTVPDGMTGIHFDKLDFSSVLDLDSLALGKLCGSNAWAVHGSKTTSGAPILCNDPHLPLTNPSMKGMGVDEVSIYGRIGGRGRVQ